MAAATITTKGQVTIPREVRAALGVGAGDRLDFIRMEDGNYAIVPASRSIRSLRGVLGARAQTVTLDEMDAAIAAGANGA
jgi:AbrB family looped-hinge helix DNA binding protein